jgi:ABC-type nitrate/sulfonate/bicarbonate transport system ATPase subunit
VSIGVSSPRPAPSKQASAGLSISGLTHSYTPAGAALCVLQGVELQIPEHHTLAVVGPSGCGKTTLLELICALQHPQVGTIRCPSAALMAQRDLLLPWFSALENAALALRIAGLSRARACAQAGTLFAELGLGGFEDARPHELSGGMRQRVAFLRTLLSGKELLCLDEPFGALDAITRLHMQRWLIDALQSQPRTVVLVTHDIEEAILLADRIAILTARPGEVLDCLDVEIPRPRLHTDPAVVALRERALGLLLGGLGEAPR